MTPLIITYVLNLLDLIATTVWIRRYGIEIEANPIARWMYQNGTAYGVKVVGVGLLLLVLYHALKAKPKWGWVSRLLMAVYASIVLYHIFIAISIYK